MTDVVVGPKGLIGELVGDGRYDLRELLGGGSMGYVYRALDRRLETPVVVKIPRQTRLERADFLKRFRLESKFLVKLTHPHIVGILDVGEHKGLPYFVMPYVGGGSLRGRQRNEFNVAKPLPQESLRSWLREMARALDFIHSQNCVHRDVKPDNILFDDHGHAFLTDFGLSKILGGGGPDDVAQTAAGAIVGTPLYVAPELVLGVPFDGKADQYSLALTVYETLSGTNPFEGPSSSATMVNQANKIAPLLHEFNPKVSPAVSEAVARGLAKAPEERFGSCAEFAELVLAAIARDGAPQASSHYASGAHQASSIQRSPEVQTPSGPETRPGRSSSGTNGLDETSPSTRRPAAVSNASAASRVAAPVRPPAAPTARKAQYVVVAKAPIVKAKSQCPKCARPLTLQPAFAGRKAACNSCQSRLIIAGDFSEVQQIELVEVRDEVGAGPAASDPGNSSSSSGDFDLVVGQELFGWKLNRRVALGLFIGLIVMLLGLTAFFVNRSNQAELKRERERMKPRNQEEG